MRKIVGCIVGVVAVGWSAMVFASSSSSVVISQVQLGGSGTGTAAQEFVELFNNTDQAVDVTDWCVAYSSASDGTRQVIGCLAAPDPSTRLWLGPWSYTLFVSPDFQAIHGMVGDQVTTYSGLSGTAGHVRLLNADDQEIDRLAWGLAAISPEAAAALKPDAGSVLQRKLVTHEANHPLLQDTDDNSQDFMTTSTALHTSGLYEEVQLIDACPNITNPQEVVSEDMVLDSEGNCVDVSTDSCINIEGVQSTIPEGYVLDEDAMCVVDVCLTIVGVQAAVPNGYELSDFGECVLIPLASDPLFITELLPNPSGNDTGREFIELYNPTARTLDLTGYVIKIGKGLEKSVFLPERTQLAAGAYLTFSDADLGFTLVNTGSRAVVVAPAGNMVDEVSAYEAAGDDMAWARFDTGWHYTDIPTPGKANEVRSEDETEESVEASAVLTACPEGKYRNPLTNRCRNIEVDVQAIAACDADEYRHPDTNRCRKIVTASSLAPCKEGQYRSPETNRCRSTQTATAELTPCKEGQERNPETNRCRKATPSDTASMAAFPVESVADGATTFAGWWALGGLGTVAAGYAGWEWRTELWRWARRLRGRE